MVARNGHSACSVTLHATVCRENLRVASLLLSLQRVSCESSQEPRVCTLAAAPDSRSIRDWPKVQKSALNRVVWIPNRSKLHDETQRHTWVSALPRV
jgi:hypothetical protein